MIEPFYKKTETFEGNHFPFKASIQKGRHELTNAHWHEHLEFLKVLEGKVRITVENKVIDAEKGDIVFVNSCLVHSVYSLSGLDVAIMAMVFDRYFITNIMEGFETKNMYSFFTHVNNMNILFSPSHALWKELSGCIEESYDEYTHHDVFYEMSIKSNIYRAVTTVMRYFKNETFGSKDTLKLTNEFMRLKPIFDYIDKNYTQKIYLKKLSEAINLSPFHFSRFFKKVTDKTPMEYINHVRLSMAMKLLVDSPLSITEISEKVGFCNINYFDKVFKGSTGTTPAEFRNGVSFHS